jgi:hydrogenase-1 operon protein HyaF
VSGLHDIGVRVETGPGRERPTREEGGLGAGVGALLAEVASLLERLASDGRPGAIDLRSLPMSPADRLSLRRALGEGEVEATMTVDGPSNIRETGVPGVWWVEHHDRDGKVSAEFLDIACVPDLLARAPEEVAAGATELRALLAGFR